jgi:predicted ATPase
MEQATLTPPGRPGNAFVGRAADLARLARAFAEGARLCTLVGPPGVGKSRLAFSHAAAAEEAGQAVFACSLASVTDDDAVLRTVCHALGLPPLPEEDRHDRVVEALVERSGALLVLDGFEQVLEGTARLVAALLASVPRLEVLTASREPLRLPEEVRVRVDPLPPDDGVELFRLRAQAHGADAATLADRATVYEIVRRLDGLPLAIELAAARAVVLSPSDILARLERRFQLLRSDGRTTDPRQATLQASIDSAWEMLSSIERITLAQCSVFPDAFTAEAAEAVVVLDGETEILDVLQGLRERSLLRSIVSTSDDGSQATRLGLYESIRQYAADRLEEGSGARPARDRHARYYAQLAERLTAASSTVRREQVLSDLAADEAHFVQAYRHTTDPPDRARLAIALAILHEVWGPRSRQLAITEVAVRAAEEALSPALLAVSLQLRGHALLEMGRFRDAVIHFVRAVDLAREAGDGPTERFASTGLALVAKREARFDEVEVRCARILKEASEDEAVRGAAISCFSFSLVVTGRLDEARRLMEEELAIALRTGSKQHEGACRVALGLCDHGVGDFGASRQHYEAAIALLRIVGPHFELVNALLLKAWMETEAQAFETAQANLDVAIAEQRHLADETMEAWARSGLGLLRLMEGRFAEAAEAFASVWASSSYNRLVASQALPLGVMALSGADRLADAESLLADIQSMAPGEIASLGGLLDVAAASVDLCRARAAGAGAEAAGRLESVRERIAAAPKDRAEPRTAALALARDLARTEAILSGRPIPEPAAVAAPAAGSAAGVGGPAVDDRAQAPGDRPPAAEDRAPAPDDRDALVLDGEVQKFKPPGKRRWVDLGRRGAVRRILVRLADARTAGEGPLTVDDLLEAGWPGEKIGYEAGVARVYSAVRTLRKLGLQGALETVDGGYRIAPQVPVRRS